MKNMRFSEGMRIYSDSKVSRFLNAITKEQTIGFLDDWNRNRDHKQRIYISYDSSNKNCQAGDIDLIEYGKTVKSKLYEDDNEERFFHIYFNPSRQAAEREQLEVKLDKFKLYMDKHLGEEITLGKTYHHYFQLIFDKKGRLLSYKERDDVIQRELQLCGYFCIITSVDMTASQALIHYKGRDISEKLFSADKSFIGSKSMRICTNEAMAAKLFIEFIALIIRNRIYNLLKETMLSLEQRPNYMTVPAAIRELEKIELIRRKGGSYRLDHAVSKRQKVILSSFGINADDISIISIEIDKLLKDSQSFMDSDEENDEEEI
jgi:hypothetical protein